MPRTHKGRFLLVVSLLLIAAVALVLTSCSRENSISSPTSSGGSNVTSALSAQNPNDVALAMRVQNAHTPELMKIPDVVGTGTGVAANGHLAVLVLTRKPGVGNIPAAVDGVPTEVRVVGDVLPYAKPGGGILECGTSTGNDLECAAGTIGAVVLKGGVKYLLSNNHVYARENAASIGEREDAPGRYDGKPRCAVTPACGTLDDFQAISFSGSNTIDCAIARMDTSRPTAVTQSGGYTASATVAAASVGQAVKKSGRTSGLTHGTVQAINVTIQVQYTGGIATFNGQIMTPATFIRSGDSGSLMVTETGNNPVGLCFAGGSGGSFANPIGPVLQKFAATIATQ
jgi:hypothetical protein